MLFNNATFRDLLYTPIIVKSKKDAEYQEKLFNIENIRKVNAMFLFPFLDYDRGFSFLLVTTGLIEGDEITLYDRPNFDTFQVIRKDTLNDKEFFFLKDLFINNDFDIEYYVNYAIRQTESYRDNDEIEMLRFFEEFEVWNLKKTISWLNCLISQVRILV